MPEPARPPAPLVADLNGQLELLVAFWTDTVVDVNLPGFFGEVDPLGVANSEADRGAVLCARLLWFLAEAAEHSGDDAVAEAADHVYAYAENAFRDKELGGFHWKLRADASVASDRKQTFGQAFFIYAYCAYYRLRRDAPILRQALELWQLLEQKTKSPARGAHLAAFDSKWRRLADMGLDDINAPFTFDTELHILEAYAALYKLSPSPELAADLRECLDVLDRYFLDRAAMAMRSDLDQDGKPLSPTVLYGHTVESAWLIWDAVETLSDPRLSAHWRPLVLALIDRAVAEGIAPDGRLIEGYDRATGARRESSVWWMQAEAMVALLTADQLRPDAGYLGILERVWDHVSAQHIDSAHGAWLATARDDGSEAAPLVHEWKGPYHTGRALLECIRYLTRTS